MARARAGVRPTITAPGRGPALLGVGWKSGPVAGDAFPWSVPAVRALDRLDLAVPVTFFVGENGSGKSTLLEAIAIAAGVRAVGTERDLWRDPSLDRQAALARALRLAWAWKPAFGFFLRAEDFFGHLRARARLDARIEREDFERRGIYEGPTEDDAEVETAHVDELGARRRLAEIDTRSHGESFLDYFAAQLDAPGLYLLDEPETPLSPQRQLALLALLADAARGGAQLVVATHSPILLALPGARIYAFDEGGVRETPYDELEHVRVTRDFLNAPERFLRHLT